MNWAKLLPILKRRDRFLITSHINPEGDSIGSQLALQRLLRRLGKRSVVVNHDRVPDRYFFLPGAKGIRRVGEYRKNPAFTAFGAVFVLDCPSVKRTGDAAGLIGKDNPVINVDHHQKNENFGSFNFVDPDACSAGEMVYRIHRFLKKEPDRPTAVLLYVAVVADTGSFGFANTNFRTHRIAGELLEKYGLKPERISRLIYYQSSYGAMKLLGLALTGLKMSAGGKIASTRLTPAMFARAGAGREDTENFIEYLRRVRDTEVAVMLTQLERGKTIKVNLRSTGKADVSRVARSFGGGGHRAASGCTVAGGIEDVERKVLGRVREELKRVE